MIAIMTAGLSPNVIAVLLAALAVVATGCVSSRSVYRSVGWSTLVLIAGMPPLATALEKTGVTAAMATSLTHLLADLGPCAMLSVLFLITAVVSLFVSNTATAVLMAPVAIGAPRTSRFRPMHSPSPSPVPAPSSRQSRRRSALVLGPGRYGFNDFIKVGLLMLTLVVTVVTVGMLYALSPPQR